MTIFDASARSVDYSGRKFVFDANVYIFVDGFDPRPVNKIYSNFYFHAVKNYKTIVCDYIISEYFNKCCKIQYNLEKENSEHGLNYKKRRLESDFIEYMETVRDSCAHFLSDSSFTPAITPNCDIEAIVTAASKGSLDFSDSVLVALCRRENSILVTDDRDFIDAGIDVVTANKAFLTEARDKGLLHVG